MKKLYFYLILQIIFINNIFAQLAWQPYSGPYGENIFQIKKFNLTLFVGTDQRAYKSTNNGLNWDTISINGGVIFINTDVNNNIIYMSNKGVYRSINNGLTWNQIHYLDINSMAINSEGHIFIGYSNVLFRSLDFGNNWEMKPVGNILRVYNIKIDNLNNIYVASDSGIFISSNNAQSFQKISNLQAYSIHKIENNILLIGTQDGKIYKKNGNNELLVKNIGKRVNSFIELENSVILAATNGYGVYSSSNISNYENWLEENLGLINRTNYAFEIDFENHVLVGTLNDGIYRTTSSITSVENLKNSKDFNLKTMSFPNPFNSQSKIEFQLPYSGNVSITVYDILGNEVITLLNEYKNFGKYELTFDGTFLSSGVYFYKILFGDKIVINKILLIK